jgi:transcriptional regulator with XRE-family HTH domain
LQLCNFIEYGARMAENKGFDGEGYYKALCLIVDARKINWRQVSKETGVGASTLTRMSQGKGPDAGSLAALSAWSGLNPADFVEGVVNDDPSPDTVRKVAAILRAARPTSR